MIAQVGAKAGGDGLRNLDGGKLDAALADRVPGKRRRGDQARRTAIEESP